MGTVKPPASKTNYRDGDKHCNLLAPNDAPYLTTQPNLIHPFTYSTTVQHPSIDGFLFHTKPYFYQTITILNQTKRLWICEPYHLPFFPLALPLSCPNGRLKIRDPVARLINRFNNFFIQPAYCASLLYIVPWRPWLIGNSRVDCTN